MPSPDEASRAPQSLLQRSRWWRWGGLTIGLILFLAAIVLTWRQREVVLDAMRAMAELPPSRRTFLLGVMVASIFCNIVLTGLIFSVLTARLHPKRVSILEMQALIAAANLLNIVPLRPGLLGRVAYHKAYHQIPVAHSAAIVIQSMALSAMAALLAMTIVLVQPLIAINIEWMAASVLAGFMILFAVMPRATRLLALAAGMRLLDLFATAARYWAAFALIGSEIDSRSAIGFAAASMIAVMVPFLSNGLGLREWAIGLLTPVMSPHQLALGITADLLNRAVELVVAAITGTLGLLLLARIRMKKRQSEAKINNQVRNSP